MNARLRSNLETLADTLSEETGIDTGTAVSGSLQPDMCKCLVCRIRHSQGKTQLFCCCTGLQAHLTQCNTVVLCASEQSDGALLAFAVCRTSSLAWHVINIVTAPSARRRGVATSLLQVRMATVARNEPFIVWPGRLSLSRAITYVCTLSLILRLPCLPGIHPGAICLCTLMGRTAVVR